MSNVQDNEHFKTIEASYPHLGLKFKALWGQPEFNTVVTGLIYDTRGGKRSGFPQPVLGAIFALALAHEIEHPHLVPRQKEVWNLRR